MATETELKFIVQPRVLGEVLRLPWLKDLIIETPRKQRLVSTYFDTVDRALAKRQLSLRIRKKAHSYIQTVKAFRPKDAGVERDEWEAKISGSRLDLDRLEDKKLRKILKAEGKSALRPFFQTSVTRTSVPLCVGSSVVELALDRGAILASRRRAGIHEIELELKRGKKADLYRLGRRLARNVAAEYGLWAKAERGYALKAGLQGQPTFAAPIMIDASMSVEEAFRIIGFSCLRHCDGNREAVIRGDAEGLHQMRVALRRLRVAMAVFQGKAASASALGREVKWLIAQLTPARDFDVFLHEHLIPRCKAEPNCVGLKMLLKAARQRRRSEFTKIQTLVTGGRYRKFILETVLLLSSDPAKAGKARELQEVASACFEHLVHGIRRRLKQFDRLDAKERHKLRIMAKKVRYAADFFEPLYSDKRNGARLKRFKKAVKDLQDILGTLNDIAVHQKLIQTLLLEPGWNRQRQGVFELGVLSESERLQAGDLKKTARRAGKALAHAPCFWET